MREFADHVCGSPACPSNNVDTSCSMLGDVLIDAGLTIHGKRALATDREPRHSGSRAGPHTLRHIGSTHHICERARIHLWCGARDIEAVESGKMVARGGEIVRAATAHPAVCALTEGDIGEPSRWAGPFQRATASPRPRSPALRAHTAVARRRALLRDNASSQP
jgi:hypothetical protein